MRLFISNALLFALAVGFVTPAFAQSPSAGSTAIAAGQAAYDRKDFAKAIQLWTPALAHFRAEGNTAAARDQFIELAVSYDAIFEDEKCVDAFQRVVTIDRSLGDHADEAKSLLGLALANDIFGRYDAALIAARLALNINRSFATQSSSQEDDLQTIATIETHLGQIDAALDALREALALALKSPGQVSAQAATLLAIAGVYDGAGRYSEARDAEQQAFELYRANNGPNEDRRGEARALYAIAATEEELGQYDAALAAGKESYAIAKKLNDGPDGAKAAGIVANVQRSMGNTTGQLAAIQAEYQLGNGLNDDAIKADALSRYGTLESDSGADENAMAVLDRAISMTDGRAHPELLLKILMADGALQLKSGRFTEAERSYGFSVKWAKTLGKPEGVWQSAAGLAAAESRRDERSLALADYEYAIAEIERLRASVTQSGRDAFVRDKLSVYDSYVAYLLDLHRRYPDQGYDRKIFEVLERKNSRAFVEQIAGSAAQRFRGVSADRLAQDRDTESRLNRAREDVVAKTGTPDEAAARSALATATTRRTEFENRLRTDYPDYYSLLHPLPVSLQHLQEKVLGPNEVVLLYVTLPEQSLVLAITREHVVLEPLLGAAELGAGVARFRKHISTMLQSVEGGRSRAQVSSDAAADLPQLSADSNALYKQLMPTPINDLINGKQLVVIPSGALYTVPWEALVTQSLPNGPRYLIEDHAVAYTPSASLLALVRESNSQAARRLPLLAFAAPNFGDAGTQGAVRGAPPSAQFEALRDDLGGSFSALPGTKYEADAVRKALRAGSDSVLSGDDASKERLLALNESSQLAGYRYIVFATHAILPDHVNGVNQPSLVLAHPGRQPTGGFVSMADVFALKLDADFVALSACNTAEGARDAGNGISGLTRAFLFAGTPAISVTMWDVDDSAAPQITPVFFEAMSRGISPAEALRAAKRRMLTSNDASFRHPYAWATTVIFGNGDTLLNDTRNRIL